VHAERGGDVLGADLLGGLLSFGPGQDLQDRQRRGVRDLASGSLQSAGNGEQRGHQLLHVLAGRDGLSRIHAAMIPVELLTQLYTPYIEA
jgi:hypothetical protein